MLDTCRYTEISELTLADHFQYGTVKFFENFWKGLSHDKQQISPIPPMPYGDRFIKFISGITKTREDVEAEFRTSEAAAPNSMDATGRPNSYGQHTQRTLTDNSVVQAAEVQAAISKEKGANEDSFPERILTTMESPSTERGADRGNMTLPIVEEVGESSSTGGRSGGSGRSLRTLERDDRPLTPSKDEKYLAVNHGTSLRTTDPGLRVSIDSNKALPPLPNVDDPVIMNEKESLTEK